MHTPNLSKLIFCLRALLLLSFGFGFVPRNEFFLPLQRASAETVVEGTPQVTPRPNILLIMCDDMGFSDIGCYGGEIQTPNLDRLAGEGMRFRTFYNNAKCEHTRASLLTGHWWHHVGASPSVHYSSQTFGEKMRAAG